MSWLSKALHGDTSSIVKLGGVVAAPFTGGASLAVTASAVAGEQKLDAAQAASQTPPPAAGAQGQASVAPVAQFSRPSPAYSASNASAGSGNAMLLAIAGFLVIVLLFLKRK